MLIPIQYDPVVLQCDVNDTLIKFELDSGSHLSTISVNELRKLKNITLKPTYKRAKGYSNNEIEFQGEVDVSIHYCGVTVSHTLLVVNECCTSLLGRDLCKKLHIKISLPSSEQCNVSCVNNIFTKYKHFLSNEFQSNVSEKVSLKLRPNSDPIFCKSRPVPFRLRQRVKSELDRLESSGIISKVFSSQWACPTVNVLKSNGEIRICGDYSMSLNKCMNTVQYPLPSIEDVLGRIGGSQIFSKIDLQNAYLQLPLDDASKQFTTINTSEGLYQYNYLPFGVSSSPAIFQSFISKVLVGIDDIIVYLDDILVLTPDKERHNETLDKVFKALQAAGLKVNYSKCAFYTHSVSYLGHVFTKSGIQPDYENVRAILDAPKPVNVKQVQSFVGLCNFYSRFVKNFSQIFQPLYAMLKKGSKFEWGSEQDTCFTIIKNLFSSNNILRTFNSALATKVETDASSIGLGAVLMQEYPDGWYPVQFASRTLNRAERNYSQIEREALSVVFACEKFRQYLLGSPFVINNDHRPLLKFFSGKSGISPHCSARLKRWALRLAQFNYQFVYTKGLDNVNSDFLSRLPLSDTENHVEPYELIFVVDSFSDTPLTYSDIEEATNSDSNLCTVKEYIRSGFPNKVHSSLELFKNNLPELSLLNGCIMFKNRVFIPKILRSKILNQLHEGHPGITGMRSIARALIWYPGLDADIVNLVKNCKNCQGILSKPPQNCNVEWPKPNRKWSRLHVDHFFFQDKTFLLVIDPLTKYIECEICGTSTRETVEALRAIFSRNGLPDALVTDNATSFTSSDFKEFLLSNRIVHITPPPYSPSSNGQAERAVKVIKDLLKKNVKGSIRTRLSNVLLYYRNVSHSVTNTPPSVALNNRNYVTIKEKVNPNFAPKPVRPCVKPIPMYNIGDHVLAMNFGRGAKWYTGVIVSKLGQNVYNVDIQELGVTVKRHKHQLRLLEPVK